MGSRLLPSPTNIAKLEVELKAVMCGNPTIVLEAMLRNLIISHTAVSKFKYGGHDVRCYSNQFTSTL